MFSFSGKSKLSCALLGAAVAGAMVMGAANAGAELIVKYEGASQTSTSPSQWTYNYQLSTGSVSGGQQASIGAGDYFVLVGFDGYVSTNISPADWTVSEISSATGPALPGGGVIGSDALVYGSGNYGATVTTYSDPYTPGSSNPPTAPIGTSSQAFPITGSPDLLFKYTGSPSSTIISPLSFSVVSTLGDTLPSSELGNYATDRTTSSNPILVPGISSTPAGPLPLPATFWPGLGTLAAMALVGGVKLRKKFV